MPKRFRNRLPTRCRCRFERCPGPSPSAIRHGPAHTAKGKSRLVVVPVRRVLVLVRSKLLVPVMRMVVPRIGAGRNQARECEQTDHPESRVMPEKGRGEPPEDGVVRTPSRPPARFLTLFSAIRIRDGGSAPWPLCSRRKIFLPSMAGKLKSRIMAP